MSRTYHEDADGAYVYSAICRSSKLTQLAHDVLDGTIDVEEFTDIFIDETGEFVEKSAVSEGLLRFAVEEHGPFSAVDVEDIRHRLEK
jgi:hypothetical protein